ncbi:MAG: HAMP domain-containing histidine kinase [Melioribacteraceae bacterium]|nr:HAMP domain-containing histidine kinase [Melioribacteraceae bacterium]
MIKLVPDWAYEYEAYWNSIKNRNLWLIQLRYGAVLMLGFLYLSSNMLNIELSDVQLRFLIIITFTILLYNLGLHKLRQYITCTPGKFNPLHFSLLQIFLDLVALMLLVYYTGTIETPLYMLFIFHMIIGSLIMPGYVIFSIALFVMTIFTGIVGLEYYNIIPHHHLIGIHQEELKHNFNFIFSAIGLFNFTVFTAVLITSRIAKRLYKREQELIETLRKLDEAEKAKQKYTMAVVHEIKSPIVAAQSIIEIVKNGYLGPVNDRIIEKLARTISRTEEALGLINNILRISKLKLLGEVSFEDVDPREVINLIIEQKNDLIKQKGIETTFICDQYNGEIIQSDKVLFELIVSNIMGNALKYTMEGGILKINLKSDISNIGIEFSDNGIGIPKDEITKIFKQFFRASNLYNKKIEGSGLGLSLVKEIVERFNGTISIESPSCIGDENRPGTTVLVMLPIKQTVEK